MSGTQRPPDGHHGGHHGGPPGGPPGGPSSGKILDANLAKLLRHAYVPALPRASFREALREEWLANVRRAARKRVGSTLELDTQRAPGRPRRLRLLPVAAAAAAVLLAVFLLLRDDGSHGVDPASILARGAVAVQGADGWYACEADASLTRRSTTRAIRTPSAAGVTLVEGDDRLRLGPDTVATLRDAGEGTLEATLERGRLHATRTADGGAWLLRAGGATLRFEHGELELTAGIAGSSTAHLRDGSAFLLGADAPVALITGRVQPLGDAGPNPEAALTASSTDPNGPARSPVAGQPQGEPSEETEATPAAPSLRGSVRTPDGDAPPAFTVGLLPVRRGNDFYSTELFSFTGTATPVPESAARDENGNADPGAQSAGAFLCEGLRPRAYDVFVHAPGFALLHAGRHQLETDAGVDLGTLELRTGNSVQGLLVDAATRAPVVGAQIVSEDDCGASGLPFDPEQVDTWLPIVGESGAGGGFELAALNPGSHRLRISAAGYAPRWIDVQVHEDRVTNLEPVLLSPGAVLTGTAFGPDGLPLQGARLVVTMMDETAESMTNFALAETEADGRYRVENLPPGPLLAIYLGLGREPSDVRPVQVRSGAETVQDFGQPPVGTRLTGTVIGSDGLPLAQRNLSLVDEAAESADSDWMATSSDADGRFTFEGVAPGRYNLLEVDRFGRWLSLVAVFDVPDWPEVHHDLVRKDRRIEGRIASTLGEEIPEAWVLLGRMDGGVEAFAGFVRVTEDGRFAWSDLPDGEYVLTSYATDELHGFATTERFVLDAASPVHEVLLEHAAGTRIDVQVRDGEDRAVVGATISFLDETNRVFQFDRSPTTNDAGLHRALGVRPGRYSVEVRHPDFLPTTTTLDCRAGVPQTLRVLLRDRETSR